LRAKEAIAKLAGADNPLLTESALKRVAALQAELVRDGSSAEERLAAENVAVCWLAAYEAELTASKKVNSKKSAVQAERCEWRRDRAQRRYQAALRMLATVRTLLRPALKPIEIASRLEKSRPRSAAPNLRCTPTVDGGQPVMN
jgi:hypothetical protein